MYARYVHWKEFIFAMFMISASRISTFCALFPARYFLFLTPIHPDSEYLANLRLLTKVVCIAVRRVGKLSMAQKQ
jgi:hypothetical protein